MRTARAACAMGHARAARSRPRAALSAASSSIVPIVSLILYRVFFNIITKQITFQAFCSMYLLII